MVDQVLCSLHIELFHACESELPSVGQWSASTGQSKYFHPLLSVNLTVGCLPWNILLSAGASLQSLKELGSSRSDPSAISAARTFHSTVDENVALHSGRSKVPENWLH